LLVKGEASGLAGVLDRGGEQRFKAAVGEDVWVAAFV